MGILWCGTGIVFRIGIRRIMISKSNCINDFYTIFTLVVSTMYACIGSIHNSLEYTCSRYTLKTYASPIYTYSSLIYTHYSPINVSTYIHHLFTLPDILVDRKQLGEVDRTRQVEGLVHRGQAIDELVVRQGVCVHGVLVRSLGLHPLRLHLGELRQAMVEEHALGWPPHLGAWQVLVCLEGHAILGIRRLGAD